MRFAEVQGVNHVSVLRRMFDRRRIDPITGCWLWTGTCTKFGHGVVTTRHGRGQVVHRLAYYLFIDDIPDGYQVLHSCDVPNCFNPEHLWAGTQSDNIRDMVLKGRAKKKYGRLSLTLQQAEEIRALQGTGITQREVGERYGCTAANIGKIWAGKRWRPTPASDSQLLTKRK